MSTISIRSITKAVDAMHFIVIFIRVQCIRCVRITSQAEQRYTECISCGLGESHEESKHDRGAVVDYELQQDVLVVDDALRVHCHSAIPEAVVLLALALVAQHVEGGLDLAELVCCIWSLVLVGVQLYVKSIHACIIVHYVQSISILFQYL
jgi:hypothetical protein